MTEERFFNSKTDDISQKFAKNKAGFETLAAKTQTIFHSSKLFADYLQNYRDNP